MAARALGDVTLFDDSEAFDQALSAALTGQGGLCVVSAPDSDKSVLLGRAIAALPRLGVAVIRLGGGAGPREIEAALRPQAGERVGRRLILVEEAQALSDAALDALNAVATRRRPEAAGAGLLLAGTPALLERMVAGRAQALLRYPAFTLDALSDVAVPAARPAMPHTQRGAIERLPHAMLSLAAVAIAGSLAVFVLVPHGVDRSGPDRSGPDRTSSAPVAEVGDAAPSNAPAFDDPSPVPLPPYDTTTELTPPPDDRDQAPPTLRGQTLGGPGLLLVARDGDTLQRLYRSVYEGSKPPPFQEVADANPHPIRPGVVVIFPTPPDGWRKP